MKKTFLAIATVAVALGLISSCNKSVESLPETELTLELELLEATSDIARIKVVASDEETTWYAGYVLRSEYTDDEALVEADMAKFGELAQEQGKSLAEVISASVHSGSKELEFSGLEPKAEYYAYAYSLDEEGSYGEMSKIEFATEPAAPVVELGLTISEVTSDIARIEVVASDEETTWYAGYVLRSEYTDDEALVEADMAKFGELAQEQGKSLAEVISASVHSGSKELEFSGLEPSSEYYAYAYGLNADGLYGQVYKTEFMTESDDPYLKVKVGDFFMNDGSILSGEDELTQEQKDNCIGVVAYVGNEVWNEDVYLQRECPDCSHGIVISLNNISESTSWSNVLSHDINGWVEDYWNDWMNGFEFGGVNLQGFGDTYAVRAYIEEKYATMPLFEALGTYSETVSAPENTSDWYIPSLKELVYVVTGEMTSEDNILDTFETVLADKLNVSIEKAGGSPIAGKIWSSTVSTASGAFFFDLEKGKAEFALKYSEESARALLAF